MSASASRIDVFTGTTIAKSLTLIWFDAVHFTESESYVAATKKFESEQEKKSEKPIDH